MKKTILLSFLFLPLLAMGQLNNNGNAETPAGEFTVGDYLVTSANLEYASVALSLVSAGIFYLAVTNEDFQDPALFIGGAAGVGAFFCRLASIKYKKKAGLKLNENATLNAKVSTNGVALAINF